MTNFKKWLELANPIYWPAWLGIGILWFIIHLPIRWRLNLGKSLGKLIYLLPSKLKTITAINIKMCFPDLSAAEQERLARNNFAALGIGLIEAAMAWWLPNEKLKHLFTIHGMKYVEEAFAQKKRYYFIGAAFHLFRNGRTID